MLCRILKTLWNTPEVPRERTEVVEVGVWFNHNASLLSVYLVDSSLRFHWKKGFVAKSVWEQFK